MFLKFVKKKIIDFDRKLLNSFILNTYLNLKYFFKIKKVYLSLKNTEINYRKKHTLKKELIISLTSYHERFKTLPLVLNSLQNQTVLADKIELWIEEKDKSFLPSKIFKFRNIIIKFCENDLFSYKKIIPALKENDDRYIVTFDDDIIYPEESLEALISKSKEFPNDVIANKMHAMKVVNKLPDTYNNWNHNFKGHNNYNFSTGAGGVLYPPKCFYKDILDVKNMMLLCPSNDDIWLNWMVKLNKSQIRYSGINLDYSPIMIRIIKSGLYKKNVKQNFNDVQIKRMIEKYGFPYL